MLLQEIIYPPIVILNFIMMILVTKKSCKVKESPCDWMLLTPHSFAYFSILSGMNKVQGMHVDIIFILLVSVFIFLSILYYNIRDNFDREKFDIYSMCLTGYIILITFYNLSFSLGLWNEKI